MHDSVDTLAFMKTPRYAMILNGLAVQLSPCDLARTFADRHPETERTDVSACVSVAALAEAGYLAHPDDPPPGSVAADVDDVVKTLRDMAELGRLLRVAGWDPTTALTEAGVLCLIGYEETPTTSEESAATIGVQES